MKKLLLSIVCAFTLFALSAQVISENFSDYTTGGKIAQQAQAMGRDYWTTWDNNPGGNMDGIVAEMPTGNKCLRAIVHSASLFDDNVLRLGTKNGSVWEPRTTGKWELTFKIYIPAGKDGYFNIKSVFPSGDSPTWAMQIYMGTDESQQQGQPGPSTPGVGKIYGGSETGVSFNFAHDTWVPIKIYINLDDDIAEFYVNGNMVHTYTYSLGSFGQSNHRYIAAFNIFPPNTAATSLFYVDDIVFAAASGPEILYATGFDDKPSGSYVAQSYPDWWTTWDNKPGTAEDALITNEQSQSPNNSAKCAWGTDLVFKAGDKTTGLYTIDFDMYIPAGGRAFFNLLHVFAGGGSEWAVGVYFNTTAPMPVGSNIQQNGQLTPFTFPYATWFPVHFDVDLDNNLAKVKINNVELLTWEFSLKESGGQGLRQLGAVDFYPPQSGSLYYIDNFVYAKAGTESYVELNVTPDEIFEQVNQGSSTSITKPITITNSGNSMGDYTSWIEFDFAPTQGTNNYSMTYSGEDEMGAIGYNNGPHTVEVAAKYPLSSYCDKVGTYINKVSYLLPTQHSPLDGKLTARVYGGGTFNKPGKILAEATKSSGLVNGDWNDITFSTPVLLDGQDIWVAFEFKQAVGGYLMTYSGDPWSEIPDPTNENSNWERLNGGSWSQLFEVQGNPIGPWMIKVFTQGKTVPGCWLSLSGKTYGNIPGGNNVTFNAILNPTGLNYGYYPATIKILTNDEVNGPLFEIPTSLVVMPTSPAPIMAVKPTSIKEETPEVGITITVPVTVKNYGNANGTYSASVDAAVKWISLSGNISGTVAGGNEDVFNVLLNTTDLDEGNYATNISVTTNDVNNPTIVIPCKLTIDFNLPKPILSIDTELIEQYTETQETITVPIKITNSGTAAGTYNAVVVNESDWLILSNAQGSVAAEGNTTFNALFNSESLSGFYVDTIRITTNDKDNPLFEIPCTFLVIVGIDEHTIKTLVFPNPADNNVTVKSNYNINTIQIVNFVGQTVFSTSVNKEQTNINTSSLNSGIYFIRVNTEVGSQNVKLIIK